MHIINNWITKQYIGIVDTSKLGTLVYIYLIRVPVRLSQSPFLWESSFSDFVAQKA